MGSVGGGDLENCHETNQAVNSPSSDLRSGAKLLKDGFTVLAGVVAYHCPKALLCKTITPGKQQWCIVVPLQEK